MEKAIEIKRRAQRCILNGDLDGALGEYEKLVAAGDTDPYHSVLVADLLHKKGDGAAATKRYLEAVEGYEKAGLYKNAIAVCKKMARLSLAPAPVLKHLARLHALDGLTTESSLYYMQCADLMIRQDRNPEAIASLTSAFEVCPDNVRALERLGEVHALAGDHDAAARTLLEAAENYERQGQLVDAKQCQRRADQLRPGLKLARRPEPSSPRSSGSEPASTVPADEAGPSESKQATPSPPPSPQEEPITGTVAVGTNDAGRIDSGSLVPAAAPSLAPSLKIERLSDTLQTPEQPAISVDSAATEATEEPDEASLEGSGLSEVSMLLNQAQLQFRQGDRQAASTSLVRAAQAYDRLGRLESAASIYRSLSQSAEPSLQIMMLWLKNCQRRDDRTEAARVACDLGDRALNEGDAAGAREWFERARAFDENNELALRRLQHLNSHAGEGAVATVAEWIAPAAPEGDASRPEADGHARGEEARRAEVGEAPGPETRRDVIDISLDQEAIASLDLGSLIAEFQRGLEILLDSDRQGHYDLAMSYYDMGLLEQAVESFRTAAQAPEFLLRSTEMIARCMLDQGRSDEAAEELAFALKQPGLDPAAALALRYQLGLALEVGGHLDSALAQFERIYAAQPSYPDVALKIRVLRKMLERD